MVDLQSTNRTKLSKVRETTYGVIPTNPVFKAVRNTASTLNASPVNVVSNEIRQDRQLTDVILVGEAASGDINGELSFKAFDDDFEEALEGTWAVKPCTETITADTEISDLGTAVMTVAAGGEAFVAGMVALLQGFNTPANNKLARVTSSTATAITFPAASFSAEAVVPVGANVRVVGFQGASGDIAAILAKALTSTALDFTTLGLNVGDWVFIAPTTGFTTTANNGFCRISAIAANQLTFDIVPTGWAADTGTGKTILVFAGDSLRNGSTLRSNTVERQYLDHSPVSYEYFTGEALNQMVLSLGTQGIITMTKSYLGATAQIASVRQTGATDVDAPTYDVMNTSSDVAELDLDGSIISGPNFVQAVNVTINNNLRQQNGIGSIGAVGTGKGEFNVTLSQLQTYFGSPAIYQKLLNRTPFGFAMRLRSPSPNKETYLVDIPKLKMQTGAPGISGKNADVILDGTAQAILHPVLGYTIGINRSWYLPV